MSATSITLMIVIPGIIWGGFILCLSIAIHREGKKPRD